MFAENVGEHETRLIATIQNLRVSVTEACSICMLINPNQSNNTGVSPLENIK